MPKSKFTEDFFNSLDQRLFSLNQNEVVDVGRLTKEDVENLGIAYMNDFRVRIYQEPEKDTYCIAFWIRKDSTFQKFKNHILKTQNFFGSLDPFMPVYGQGAFTNA